MNTMLQTILLAVIQGITEFLPVSSSGHLVLIGKLIEFEEQGNLTEVVLHAGTFLAVLAYFRKRLMALISDTFRGKREALAYLAALAAGSLPLIAVYFLACSYIEALFDKPVYSAVFLCVTGMILLSLKIRRDSVRKLSLPRAFLVGLAQAAAMLPGISRSGSTIAAARHMGITADRAAEFSFLLYLPAMAGAILIKTKAVLQGDEIIVPLQAAVGVCVSALVGYLALMLLMNMLKRNKLWIFGIYCIAAGLISIILLML